MIQLEHEISFDCRPEIREFIKPACEDVVRRQTAEDITPLQRPKMNLDFNPYVIVNGLPQIPIEKQDRLVNALKNVLNKKQMSQDYSDVIINVSGQGLIKFASEEKACLGALALRDFQLDKQHKLQAYTLKEFEQILTTPARYTPLNLQPKVELESWLSDSQFRNQLMYVQDKSKLTLQWFFHLESRFENVLLEQPIVAEQLEWSRRGTYLVLYSKEMLHRFAHEGVKKVTFSADEEHAISFSGQSQGPPNEDYIVWHIRKEQKLKTMMADQLDTQDSLQFSPDTRWLARIEKHSLSYYQAPDFLSNKEQKLEIPNIQNFIWIEKTNYLCYAAYTGSLRECDKTAAKTQIQFIDVNTKQTLKWRQNQFESDHIELFSHTNGKWVLAVLKKKVKRKIVATILQLCNFRKVETGLDFIQEDFNEEVEQVFLEPRTGKIAVQYRDREKEQRAVKVFHYKFFAVEEGKNLDLKDMGTLVSKDTNELLWASNGSYYAFINNMKGSPDQGKLEFGLVLRRVSANNTVSYQLETTKATNHFYMSHAAWDPSGTYFVTMSDQWASVIVWSAIGEQLIKDTITKISYINWRLQPTGMLTEGEERKLVSERDEFVKRYEEEDNRIIHRAEYEKEQRRLNLHNEVVKYPNMKERWQKHRAERARLLGFDADDKSQLVELSIVEREEIVEQPQ